MSNPLDLKRFFASTEAADLGPGPRPGVQSQKALEEQLEALLQQSELSRERRDLVRALILLWHDHLDAAHAIAQNVEGADGAFVHGIMHRREPDFGNAAYWFRRVGRHSAYPQMALQVAPLLISASELELAARLVRDGVWDPFAFIDACERASSGSEPNQRVLREIQRIESAALLESLATTA